MFTTIDVGTLTLCCLLMVLLPVSLTDNVKVEYFTTVTLACDNRNLNITTIPDNGGNIRAKYWILPSGEKIDNSSTAQMQKGELSWAISDWFNYSLTVTNVNDEDFGVYYCVIVRPNYHVDIVQKGLNIDGPDYSKLIKRYRHNAMIGGIAAAVLFVIICSACLINHFRYGAKKSKNGKEGVELGSGYYDNAAVDHDTEEGKANGQYDIETSEKL